ncbi:MAG: hypothetical protein ACTSVV_00240, partial [Promethearchaeota archaeon]
MNKKRKVALFPIGIESSTGGQYGPIFKDKKFEYIPIPHAPRSYYEDLINDDTLDIKIRDLFSILQKFQTYREIPITPHREMPNMSVMSDYLLEKNWKFKFFDLKTNIKKSILRPLPDWIPHFDPEFNTFTYGEGSQHKASTISRLKKGDLLIFYASLSPPIQKEPVKKYIIGYFIIEKVFNYRENLGGTPLKSSDEVPERIKFNSHIFLGMETEPVIAVGDPDQSKLLDRAIPLSDSSIDGNF